jgi:hypothetical protein
MSLSNPKGFQKHSGNPKLGTHVAIYRPPFGFEMNKTKFPKVWGTGRVEKNIALGKTGASPIISFR